MSCCMKYELVKEYVLLGNMQIVTRKTRIALNFNNDIIIQFET